MTGIGDLFTPDPDPGGPVEAQCGNPEPHEQHIWQRGVAIRLPATVHQEWAAICHCPGVPEDDPDTPGVDT
jgi:hypothetical protein